VKPDPGEWRDDCAPPFHGTKAGLAAVLILKLALIPQGTLHKPKLLEFVRERLRARREGEKGFTAKKPRRQGGGRLQV